jgi:hypothetical protein
LRPLLKRRTHELPNTGMWRVDAGFRNSHAQKQH